MEAHQRIFFVVAWGCKKSYLYVAKTRLRNEVLNIVEKDLEIQFGYRVHMLPLFKRHILEHQRNMIKKIASTYLQSKRVCKVSSKINTLCGLCKKDKNCHVKCHIFSTKFCLFGNAT
jgi:hypothetical protein